MTKAKRPSAPRSRAKRSTQKRTGLYIYDRDVIDTMAKVEDEEWAKLQRSGRAGGYGVPAFVEAWRKLQAELLPGEVFEENVRPDLFVSGPTSDGAIYGDGGYSRYIVTGTGEVVLLASSTRPAKVALAKAAGIRVIG